jgi:hypothetical protein
MDSHGTTFRDCKVRHELGWTIDETSRRASVDYRNSRAGPRARPPRSCGCNSCRFGNRPSGQSKADGPWCPRGEATVARDSHTLRKFAATVSIVS